MRVLWNKRCHNVQYLYYGHRVTSVDIKILTREFTSQNLTEGTDFSFRIRFAWVTSCLTTRIADGGEPIGRLT